MKSLNLDQENRPIKYGLTQAERELVRDRYLEKAELRQAEANLALIQALRLAEAFRRLKEG